MSPGPEIEPQPPETVDLWPCPACGHLHEAAQSLTSAAAYPREGDWGICVHCGELTVYTGNGIQHRLPTEDEKRMMLEDTVVMQHRSIVMANIIQTWLGDQK
jgi:hypothetical protein